MTESGLDRVYAFSVGYHDRPSFPDDFPFYADLVTVTVEDGVIHRQTVKVTEVFQGRYRIKALEPTVIPGVNHPIQKGLTFRVRRKSLEECKDAPGHD